MILAGIFLALPISGTFAKKFLSVADKCKGKIQGGISQQFEVIDNKIMIDEKAANIDADFVITKDGELRISDVRSSR